MGEGRSRHSLVGEGLAVKRSRETLPVLLAAHNEALSKCVRCGLAESVRPIISEARSPRAMLVGQAPGKVEVGDRRPFAGRAGKTLFSWLGQAGVDEAAFRRDVYIAAITRCYPGPSPSGRGDRVPSTREREIGPEDRIIHLLGWMRPGEVAIFPMAERARATDWLREG